MEKPKDNNPPPGPSTSAQAYTSVLSTTSKVTKDLIMTNDHQDPPPPSTTGGGASTSITGFSSKEIVNALDPAALPKGKKEKTAVVVYVNTETYQVLEDYQLDIDGRPEPVNPPRQRLSCWQFFHQWLGKSEEPQLQQQPSQAQLLFDGARRFDTYGSLITCVTFLDEKAWSDMQITLIPCSNIIVKETVDNKSLLICFEEAKKRVLVKPGDGLLHIEIYPREKDVVRVKLVPREKSETTPEPNPAPWEDDANTETIRLKDLLLLVRLQSPEQATSLEAGLGQTFRATGGQLVPKKKDALTEEESQKIFNPGGSPIDSSKLNTGVKQFTDKGVGTHQLDQGNRLSAENQLDQGNRLSDENRPRSKSCC